MNGSIPSCSATQIPRRRTPLVAAFLVLLAACKADDPAPDVSNPAFAPAACVCWELLDIGDVYFVDEEACLAESEAFFFAFAYSQSDCVLPILAEREPDRAECYAAAAVTAIDCLQAIDECTVDNQGPYTACLLAGWDECGSWSDGTFGAVYDSCG